MVIARIAPAAGLAALAWAAFAPGIAHAAEIGPPQGYVAFTHAFPGEPEADGKRGFADLDFGLVLNALPSRATGTFWAASFVFHDSAGGLPANHVGGDQGSYMGVQEMPDGAHQAIFSIWWALEAQPGEGATCLSDLEAWYNDDRPFEPEIDDLAESDPAREVDGGPFMSCRLPVTLEAGVHYRLRLAEGGDGSHDGAGWWSAWLIDDDNQVDHLIGRVRVPAGWGRLTSEAGGFIEQFGPMPEGCASIPASETVIEGATGNDGVVQAQVSLNIYGNCEAAIRPRFSETREGNGMRVKVE